MKRVLILASLMITASAMAVEIKTEKSIGKDTYDNACQVCHNPRVSQGLDAPTAFNESVWSAIKKRADAEAKKSDKFKTGMDYMVYQVRIGKGLMHHGGLCLEAKKDSAVCTDAAYQAAIEYMSTAKD